MSAIGTAIAVGSAIGSAAVTAGTAIAGGIAAAGTAVGGAVASGLGAVGVGGTFAGAGAIGTTGIAGALGTAASMATVGGIYGAALGGVMAGVTGGDIGQGMLSGFTTGAMTGGFGSLGSSMAAGMNLTKIGTQVAAGTMAGGMTAGANLAMGKSLQQSLISGATTGVLSGMNAGNNWQATFDNRQLTYGLMEANPGMTYGQAYDLVGPNAMGPFTPDHPGWIGQENIMDTIATSAGRLVTVGGGLLGSGAPMVMPENAPTESGMLPELPSMTGGMATKEGRSAGGVIDDGEGSQISWERLTGDLFAGTESLSGSMPDIRKRSAQGLSDELLMKNGALMGA